MWPIGAYGGHLRDWQCRQQLWGSFLSCGWGSVQVGHMVAPTLLQTPHRPLPFLHAQAPVGVLLGRAWMCKTPLVPCTQRRDVGGLTHGCPMHASHHACMPPCPSQRLTLSGLLLRSRPQQRHSSCAYIMLSCRSGGKGGAGTPAKAPSTRPGLPDAQWAVNPPIQEGNGSERFPFTPGGYSHLAPWAERGGETLSTVQAAGAGYGSQASGLLAQGRQ